MKRKNLQLESGFRIVLGNHDSQAATMILPPGDAEGSPQNRHRGAYQWLYGTEVAKVNSKRYLLKEGSLMLMERGDGEELPRGRD